ncbi:RidA family protein [Hymenobacter fastidiosus]|uniref:RidA family protein n=1 Tax=Hymenobacter fastidiosus TaxID=486264 RepID=A0ABP7RGI2_9BACT
MRRTIASASAWESIVGYSRAVRVGRVVEVSGTTASGPDAYEQTRQVLEKMQAALHPAGATLADVVRTRMYVVTDLSQWAAVGRAHAEAFADIRSTTTMVQVAALIDPQLVVETEAPAIISPRENA